IEALHLGGHAVADFRDADLVVVNPAVREDDPFVQIARQNSAEITTEMNLFFRLCPAPVVGVTGSNGKSTTTAMIHSMLSAAGRTAWLGGNIGRSLLEQVDKIQPDHLVILELSSFQLEDLAEIQMSPHVAVVTTFTPNHLDRHPSLEAYRAAKQSILRYQTARDLAVLNADDPEVSEWETRSRTLFYGLTSHNHDGAFLAGYRTVVIRRGSQSHKLDLGDVLRLPGSHNLSNAIGAACCASALGVDDESICSALRSFRALPHRLEAIAQVAGRTFY